MATLVLTAEEVREARFMAGSRLTAEHVPDSLITGSLVLGAASDYVFEKVRQSLDLSKLSAADRVIAERFADERDDDIANFVNQVLKPPQRQQMRRGVLYRCTGNIIVAVQQISNERAGLIGQTVANVPTQASATDWEKKRDHFYRLADGEIERLNNAFGDDAFGTASRVPKYTLITLG